MQEKRPVYINCLDLDETLIRSKDLFRRFESDMAEKISNTDSLTKLFEDWLKNHFPQQGENLENLIRAYVIDSSNRNLIKAMKHAMSLGDKFALVTFNSSLNFAKFSLALIGFTKEEIDQIYIRYRDSHDAPENKNGYILDVVKHFGLIDVIEAAENDESKLTDLRYPLVSLVDDNPDNCDAAEGVGIQSFFVQEGKIGHIREYCDYLHDKSKAYLKVNLPSALERFALAKSLIEDVKQAPSIQRDLEEMYSGLEEALPPLLNPVTTRVLKRSFTAGGLQSASTDANNNSSTSLSVNLHCVDETLDDLEPVVNLHQAKKPCSANKMVLRNRVAKENEGLLI